jgi:hypothetical protein
LLHEACLFLTRFDLPLLRLLQLDLLKVRQLIGSLLL